MHRLVAVAVLIIACVFLATCRQQFPCNHHLRHNAMFFEHCECRYSDWTEWAIPENAITVAVPANQCPSEKAWPEERWQKVISGYQCEHKREERHICKLCNNHECNGYRHTILASFIKIFPSSYCVMHIIPNVKKVYLHVALLYSMQVSLTCLKRSLWH